MKNSLQVSSTKTSPEKIDGYLIGDFVVHKIICSMKPIMITHLHGGRKFDGIKVTSFPWAHEQNELILLNESLDEYKLIVGNIKISQEK